MNSVKYEMSKTYQYRKVMKPMLERKRRARINRCLDELKDLIVEYMKHQSGDTYLKMEKADILELTVQHLRRIKSIKSTASSNTKESFRTGYIQAANEVSRCLACLPNVDIALGTKVMTHLGFRLNELASEIEMNVGSPIEPNTPLKVCCEAENVYAKQLPTMSSPVSSGYGSDSECSTSSLLSHSSPELFRKVALSPETKNRVEIATVWRPW